MKKSMEDIHVGDKSTFQKTITDCDIFAFSGICGDFNPLHVSDSYAKDSMFKGRIAHGMLVAGMIDYTLSDILGWGAIHISQTVRFKAPTRVHDTITVESEVTSIDPERGRLKIQSILRNQEGKVVIVGEGEVMLPKSV